MMLELVSFIMNCESIRFSLVNIILMVSTQEQSITDVMGLMQ